jgi:tetratricopeptide (TPR) repeat protein
MNQPVDPAKTLGQPPLAELLALYLQRQVTAHTDGLAHAEVGEVVPFEAAPVQPIDARVAWEDAVQVLPWVHGKGETRSLKAPPHWPQLVAGHEPLVAVTFCLGSFPQLLRNFQPLIQAANLGKLRPQPGRPSDVPALLDWADQASAGKKYPQILLALGALRLAKQFDKAGQLLKAHQAAVPAEWRAAWENEAAALAWQRGDAETAYAMWQAQAESVPVLFNRGMAALFLDRPAEARTWLSKAVGQLPEASTWYHLARLYLTLAETRK